MAELKDKLVTLEDLKESHKYIADRNVAQNAATDNAQHFMLFKSDTDASNVIGPTGFSLGVKVNPYTGALTASSFVGDLQGKASSATTSESADKLNKSVKLGVSLDSSDDVEFDGSSDTLDIPVSGVLDIKHGGTGSDKTDSAWSNLGGGSVGKLNTNGSKSQYLRGDGTWAEIEASTSDENVKQTASSANSDYPILMKDETGTTTVTSGTKFGAGIKANPSTSTLTATKFIGSLEGNATSATTATNADKAKKADSADLATSANTAGKLASSVNIGVKSGTSAEATAAFDGSTAVTITLSKLDATTLEGMVPLASIPQGALERLVHVADEAARFKLTTATVQLGDTVQQDDTGVMYIVVDESKLNSAAGYSEYTAGTATKAKSADTATTAGSATTAGTADKAAQLTNTIKLGVALGTSSTAGADFNGSGNQLAIPVSGTLGIGNGGTGAITADDAWTNLGGGDIGKLNKGTSTTTYLRNDGTWGTPPNTNTWIAFVGASTTSAGTAGYVPAPGTGNQNKFFRGDGSWSDVTVNVPTMPNSDIDSSIKKVFG